MPAANVPKQPWFKRSPCWSFQVVRRNKSGPYTEENASFLPSERDSSSWQCEPEFRSSRCTSLGPAMPTTPIPKTLTKTTAAMIPKNLTGPFISCVTNSKRILVFASLFAVDFGGAHYAHFPKRQRSSLANQFGLNLPKRQKVIPKAVALSPPVRNWTRAMHCL